MDTYGPPADPIPFDNEVNRAVIRDEIAEMCDLIVHRVEQWSSGGGELDTAKALHRLFSEIRDECRSSVQE